MAHAEAFNLLMDSHVRVGGEILEGVVVLNIPLLRACNYLEVHVNLRGRVITYAPRIVSCQRIHIFIDITEPLAHTPKRYIQ